MAKILALVSFKIFPPHMGGQKHVFLFYEYLRRHHEVLMLVSNDNTDPISADFPVKPILYPNKKMASNYGLLPAIKQIIEKEKIDCIITEHSYTGWMGYLLRKKTGKPFIIHSHNLEGSRFRQMNKKGWRLYRPYEKWIHRKADHSFFISTEEMQTAQLQFSLDKTKCSVSPYGTEKPATLVNASQEIRTKYNITTQYIFHFNGTMDYEPNMDAVENLVKQVEPRLKRTGMDFTIVITGKRLPVYLQELVKNSRHLVYLDFIDDINAMYQASHLFINPVLNNSGVKTKLVEALANECTVISTASGASGIPKDCYKEKMFIANDRDWDGFCKLIVETRDKEVSTPPQFFNYFSWHNIAQQAAGVIDQIVKNAG
jgi:polysaccharide biosynthesis protein PslH